MPENPSIRPRRTWLSNVVFRLPGGTEDNDLWLYSEDSADGPRLRSCWVPTDEQREQIRNGANIELIVWGEGHPPVAMTLCAYPLGAPPHEGEDDAC